MIITECMRDKNLLKIVTGTKAEKFPDLDSKLRVCGPPDFLTAAWSLGKPVWSSWAHAGKSLRAHRCQDPIGQAF